MVIPQLYVNHYVYLTREQRYALYDGIELVVTGVCCYFVHPSSINKDRNIKINQATKEIFCKYRLINNGTCRNIDIYDEGYIIYLPNNHANIPKVSNEQWRLMNLYNHREMEKYYKKFLPERSAKCLLDFPEGKMYLSFHQEFFITINKKKIKTKHCVQIQDIEVLKDSMTYQTMRINTSSIACQFEL